MADTSQLDRRTEVYVLRPAKYEISGCKCGNNDPDWSEFKGRLWCQVCEVDFVPEFGGVFEGPIPMNVSHLMGICYATVNIETGAVTPCGEDCPLKKTEG